MEVLYTKVWIDSLRIDRLRTCSGFQPGWHTLSDTFVTYKVEL